ncbi:HNH endonuclease [Micromonospora auratinigra]|uniref:HNH endonuclease n=1 Tax=Micromonospora auratinigra TaxID=261654 RepID=A0A1A9A8R8_9ACTN|nr:HNH endonuclease [Micromonospora auratinigra]SBT52509.1 HNH endonuclease [Micromonospora auratinigra]
MQAEVPGHHQFTRLMKGPYGPAVVEANRAYLDVAVPDPAGTERDYWTLSCLPSTTRDPQRLSAVTMRTMETFVLHTPLGEAAVGVAEGYLIVRRSVLRQHWPTARAFQRDFPGLTEEDCDYRDARPDQVRVNGTHDQLVAALRDDRFAQAVRDLTSHLLKARRTRVLGHNRLLVDEVLDRDSRPGEWIYPVNEKDANWGYEHGVLETFAGFTGGEIVDWHIATCFHQIRAGDRLWAYAALPYQRIVGVGVVWTDPFLWSDGTTSERRIMIKWDGALTEFLLSHEVAGAEVLETKVQTVRALKTTESDRLAVALAKESAPAGQGMTEGRRYRLAQVTARQGQADFRRRLMDAYDGACAISGCDVPAVLQAAHIDPYDGPSTNRVTNGLLLRADLHNLFDEGLLWIDDAYRVRVATDLDHYQDFDGRKVRPTVDPRHAPDRQALRRHRQEWGIE